MLFTSWLKWGSWLLFAFAVACLLYTVAWIFAVDKLVQVSARLWKTLTSLPMVGSGDVGFFGRRRR